MGARAPVSAPDGLSFIAVPEVAGVELVAQAHGGELRVGNPGNAGGGRAAAERRRARAERSEAVDDAMVGHVEKMSGTIAQLVEEAGEQYRCPQCGSFGPKVGDH